MKVLVCSAEKLAAVISVLSSCLLLRVIILMENEMPSFEVIAACCKNYNVKIFTWNQVIADESCSLTEPVVPKPHSIATICYTSGTTGDPKGAILTHRNLSSPSNGILSSASPMYQSDIHFSYLPLAHVYERAVSTLIIGCGASIGFYSGDVNDLVEDMQVLKPTIFISVPRLFNKIYAKIVQNTIGAGGIKGFLSQLCFKTKLNNLIKYGTVTHSLWDALVCNKIKATMGGRIRKMFVGSAPIEPTIRTFIEAAFCCYMFEGYGATETCCFGAMTFDNDFTTGHIGAPPFGCELKLIDIPEMEYFTSDKNGPKGEICLRGPAIFQGYLKDPAQTEEALDTDGWFHTGDVGYIKEGCKISIIDRKKNIFKLAQGEYIAPEKLENIFTANSPFIHQILVHGDSLKSHLVAIVVLNPELDAKVKSALSKQTILMDLERIAKINRLQSYEKIKDLYIENIPFTIENDLLTPTLKLKRSKIVKKYKDILDNLYNEHSSKL